MKNGSCLSGEIHPGLGEEAELLKISAEIIYADALADIDENGITLFDKVIPVFKFFFYKYTLRVSH